MCGTVSDDVRQRLLRVEDLTLDKALSICHADAESKQSSKYLNESGADKVHMLRKSRSALKTSKGSKQAPIDQATLW